MEEETGRGGRFQTGRPNWQNCLIGVMGKGGGSGGGVRLEVIAKCYFWVHTHWVGRKKRAQPEKGMES